MPERISALQGDLKEAKKQARQAAMGDLGALADKVKSELSETNGVLWGVVSVGEIDANGLRELSARAKSFSPDHCITLLGQSDGKVPFLVLSGGEAMNKGLKAGDLAKTLAGFLGGGGGGRPDAAQGQGRPEVPGDRHRGGQNRARRRRDPHRGGPCLRWSCPRCGP